MQLRLRMLASYAVRADLRTWLPNVGYPVEIPRVPDQVLAQAMSPILPSTVRPQYAVLKHGLP